MKLCEYKAHEERRAAASELIKYMQDSRDAEAVHAVAALADEAGEDIGGYTSPRLVREFDLFEWLNVWHGVHGTSKGYTEYLIIERYEFLRVAKEAGAIETELARGGFYVVNDCGEVGAGHSMAEILRNMPAGIVEIADAVAYIIAEDAESAAIILQPFPHFLAACKPIFDAVKADERTEV